MSERYYENQKIEITERIRELRKELPYFCSEFFVGIENTTTPLTRLNYAYDLRIFFDYLIKEVPNFAGKRPQQISLFDLDTITPTQIEMYLDYLSSYEFN